MGAGSVGNDGEVIDGDPRQVCAALCAGFRYFALQFYNTCMCDNANAMSLGSAPERVLTTMRYVGDETGHIPWVCCSIYGMYRVHSWLIALCIELPYVRSLPIISTPNETVVDVKLHGQRTQK